MAHNRDYKKEWFSKSEIDYFTSFITLWLSFNSWYNFHYSLNNDRDHINRIKSDNSRSNKVYGEFERVVNSTDPKKKKNLFVNLESLHYTLVRENISVHSLLSPLSFHSILLDFNLKTDTTAYEDIVLINVRLVGGGIRVGVNAIDLGDIILDGDIPKVFGGLIEIIYQIRCLLVHGDLDPTDENKELVKYCYQILHMLMEPFCK